MGTFSLFHYKNVKCLLYQLLSASNTRSSATTKSTARPLCWVGVLYDISREKICWWLLANQPLLHNWPQKLPNSAK